MSDVGKLDDRELSEDEENDKLDELADLLFDEWISRNKEDV